jgi:hypothetical protein
MLRHNPRREAMIGQPVEIQLAQASSDAINEYFDKLRHAVAYYWFDTVLIELLLRL